MIQRQLKLRVTCKQDRQLNEWLPILASVWNWAIRKIELDGRDGIFYSEKQFHNLLANHGRKLGIPSHTIQGVLSGAYTAWRRCSKGLARKPRLKGARNKLNSVAFPDPFLSPVANRITVPGIGRVRFHKQRLPQGKIKGGRILKRASGWYLCLFIDAEPQAIKPAAAGAVGIDPGFNSLLTLSNGEKIPSPRESTAGAFRLSQAQRGSNLRLSARLQERISNQRKDRNHKLSRRLVVENQFIAFSADRHSAIAKRFGKSVSDSAHYQLRQMLSYKSQRRTDGLGVYVEVESRNSTRTCSVCGALSGPQGWAGLSVRQWTCAACGAEHDRDINAAMNTLIAGAGLAHELSVRAA